MVDLADGSGRPSLAWPVVGNFPGGLADASRFETGRGWPEDRQHQPRAPHHRRDHAAGCRRLRWSSGRSPSRTCRRRRDRSGSSLTWNGSSIVPRPTEVTPSTTACSPRWSTSPGFMRCWPGTSTPRPWASWPRTARRRASSPRGSISSAGPGASGDRGCSRRWTSRRPRDTPPHATLDPIGSLLIGLTLPARGSSRIRLLIGLAGDRSRAIDLIRAPPPGRRSDWRASCPDAPRRGVPPDRTR